jgi:putative thiamine transport system permease protein
MVNPPHSLHTQPHHTAALVLLALVGVPLLWSLWGATSAAFNAAAWTALTHDAQTLRALGMSLWTGLLSSALAVAGAAFVLSRSFGQPAWPRVVRLLGPMLAVPHAAFAIGLVFLIAPSGWLLRALSPWATGFDAPPPWLTTQDPWGLGLIAVLALKEIPFLLWAALGHLQRPDVARRLQQELQVAQTLGYRPRTAWWRVAWPQVWPRLTGPMLAVLAYGLTVVDVALVIGPTSPPTLSVLAWQWLRDADPALNAQGAAAAWLLVAALASSAGLAGGLTQLPRWRKCWVRGAPNHGTPAPTGTGSLRALAAVYASVLLALLVGSVFGSWPFPSLWPESWTGSAWLSVAGSSRTLVTTVWLGLASSLAALVWAVAWLELAPARWNTHLRQVLYLPLVLPAVLWVVGLHRLALAWGLDGQGWGVWLAHTLATLPYVLMALHSAYAGFDPRLRAIAASLGHGRWVFLLRIKWPLLRAALAASFAVGFAVSVAQYLPTLYVGAGRFATVTTEAVNLAAGAQRSLTSAYAWLQWLLPVLVFALAARLGRARRF